MSHSERHGDRVLHTKTAASDELLLFYAIVHVLCSRFALIIMRRMVLNHVDLCPYDSIVPCAPIHVLVPYIYFFLGSRFAHPKPLLLHPMPARMPQTPILVMCGAAHGMHDACMGARRDSAGEPRPRRLSPEGQNLSFCSAKSGCEFSGNFSIAGHACFKADVVDA